jgi:hypothetical protein
LAPHKRSAQLLDDYSCVLCNNSIEETSLFFFCFNALLAWTARILLVIAWDANLRPLDMFLQARTNFGDSIIRELVITACWVIWPHETVWCSIIKFLITKYCKKVNRFSVVLSCGNVDYALWFRSCSGTIFSAGVVQWMQLIEICHA